MSSPKNYIQGLLWIKTKSGQVVRFRFNEVQLKVYEKIQQLRRLSKPVRAIILKARQTGISTLTEALIFYFTVMSANISSLIIAHDKESTQHLFRMSKMFYDRLPNLAELKPMKRTSNRIELYFDNPSEKVRYKRPGLNSLIRVDTANNMQAGRAFTLQNLHCSEIAFWERPEEVMTGLMQSVPEILNTMVIIESTANGVGNYFHNMWLDAEAGNNDFTPIFIAWWELDSYRTIPAKDFEPYDYEHEIYGNEVNLAETFELDIQQLAWRRYTIKNKCNNDINRFKQEYPATAHEAFLTSGKRVFDIELINDYYKYVSEPKRGELVEQADMATAGQGKPADMERATGK